MPALWQASQRPMYIRTVWVDGFRHAILTQDDPHYKELYAKRRRPHSSASFNAKRKAQGSRLSYRSDTNYYRNPDLTITSDKIRILENPEIETLNLTEVPHEGSIQDSVSQSEVDNQLNLPDLPDMRAVQSNRTARPQVREANELSDRVLQWLDLAGKVDLLAVEGADRIYQQRHSWPDIDKRNFTKSRTVTDLRLRECKLTTNESKSREPIDRSGLHVPTSATTIENYARRSRDSKARDNPKRERKTKETVNSVAATRQKMMDERYAMEKQYADLVNKKFIPDLGKTKKQVHIFMPEAITKRIVSNTNSRTESLLSQKS